MLRRENIPGAASGEPVRRMNYPAKTDFLHSVREVSIDDKWMDNGMGWTLLASIVAEDGSQQRQTNEEISFSRGSHTSAGANIDQTQAFQRDVRCGAGYIDLKLRTDVPNVGDEFRSKDEMQVRLFREDGTEDIEAMPGKIVHDLITPSRERALRPNKACRVLVSEQSFPFRRAATVISPVNVHAHVDDQTAPTLPPEVCHRHDNRLNWDRQTRQQMASDCKKEAHRRTLGGGRPGVEVPQICLKRGDLILGEGELGHLIEAGKCPAHHRSVGPTDVGRSIVVTLGGFAVTARAVFRARKLSRSDFVDRGGHGGTG